MDHQYDNCHREMAEQPPTAQSSAKFSRYRSVRRAAIVKDQQNPSSLVYTSQIAPPPLPNDAEGDSSIERAKNESLTRSRSRYRHTKHGATKTINSVPLPPLPSTMTLPSRPHTEHIDGQLRVPQQNHNALQRNTYSSKQDALSSLLEDDPRLTGEAVRRHTAEQRDSRLGDNRHDPEGWKTSTRGADGSTPRGRLPLSSSSVPVMEAKWNHNPGIENDASMKGVRSRSESREGTKLSKYQPKAHQSPGRRTVDPSLDDELVANERAMARHNESKSVKEKGNLLARMKTLHSRVNSRDRGDREMLKKMISAPKAIDPSDVAVAPTSDAPISAVNAGERKVLVTCNDSFINLPITPTTRAQDILFSAANCLAQDIDAHSAILVESFKQLSLERPLRKYVRIRDVMNSWDHDGQNQLIVITSPEDRAGENLDVKGAPRRQPPDSSFQLYHSQRSGKWEKRWVTLRTDGQVTVAKKQGMESSNICHISDFDVYSPSTRHPSRRISAPKKICYAVKSQQKSSMFLTTENFVHYFATNDQNMAARWYKAVQEWRSWYLVNVLGEGAKPEKPQNNSNTEALRPVPTSSHPRTTRRCSVESSPYRLGSFEPLLGTDPPTWEDNSSRETPLQDPVSIVRPADTPANIPSPKAATFRNNQVNSHAPLPPAVSTRNMKPDSHHLKPKARARSKSISHVATVPKETVEEPFSPTGLLGRRYSQRQNAMRERERELTLQNQNNGPFSSQGLLSNIGGGASSPTSSHNRDRQPPAAQPPSRASSRETTSRPTKGLDMSEKRPKPLVDLTPTFMEPPQHARKGRGITVGPGTQLVDIATGPEILPGQIIIPSSTTWRRPGQRSGTISSQGSDNMSQPLIPSGGRQRSNTAHSLTRQSQNESPFSPNGLLARSNKVGTAQGGATTGRGVATGDRNAIGKPMLDVSECSQFPQGSLLRSVEDAGIGETGPVIDREKRSEGSVDVGEAF